jgi:hypothetical protein
MGTAFRPEQQSICIAPFTGAHGKIATHSMLGDFGVNGLLGNQGYKDNASKTLRFKIVIVCDGLKNIEQEVFLNVPEYNTFRRAVFSTSPITGR